MKNFFNTWGPPLFVGTWVALAGVAYGRMVWATPGFGYSKAMGGIGLAVGAAVLVLLVVVSRRRQRTAIRAKISIWSSGRPGEVLVGVLHTGMNKIDPAGLILALDCLEQNGGGQWLLWTSEVRSPAPTGPDSWPFHFSIPVEGPPTGPSTDGQVVWQLRVKSISFPFFEARFDVPVARVAGPPSHLLPVPPPSFRKVAGAHRRSVTVLEERGQTVLRLEPRFPFPGANPIVVWTVGWAGLLMILVRRKASPWMCWVLGGLNGGAALFFAVLWFAREELIVNGSEIMIRRSLWKFRRARRFPKSAVTGVRVAFSGPPPHFGVRIERGDHPPLAVFDGFTDSLDAHEAARSVLRALGLNK